MQLSLLRLMDNAYFKIEYPTMFLFNNNNIIGNFIAEYDLCPTPAFWSLLPG